MTMRVWQVTENDTQMRFYWFETKEEADAHKREYDSECPDTPAEVEPLDFKPGRKGMVAALNWVISMTCFNE